MIDFLTNPIFEAFLFLAISSIGWREFYIHYTNKIPFFTHIRYRTGGLMVLSGLFLFIPVPFVQLPNTAYTQITLLLYLATIALQWFILPKKAKR